MTPDEVVLEGVDGSNPLGFLCGLGCLVLLNQNATRNERPSPKMAWGKMGYRPILHLSDRLAKEELAPLIRAEIERYLQPCDVGITSIYLEEFGNGASLDVVKYHAVSLKALQRCWTGDRRYADQISSLGAEAVDPRSARTAKMRSRKAAPQTFDELTAIDADAPKNDASEFILVMGQGHQEYLNNVRKLLAASSSEKIDNTLLRPWKYADLGMSLRWDPIEDRRYAHSWDNPSAGGAPTEAAANLLAHIGLGQFPCMPTSRGSVTTGFSKQEGKMSLTWPLWDVPIGNDIVRSLLAHRTLQEDTPSRNVLSRIGVFEVFRSDIVHNAKFLNLSPSRSK